MAPAGILPQNPHRVDIHNERECGNRGVRLGLSPKVLRAVAEFGSRLEGVQWEQVKNMRLESTVAADSEAPVMRHSISLGFFAAALASCWSGVVIGADLTERTTMPDFCSERDVNCIIPDGPVPRIVAPSGAVTQQPTTTSTTNSSTAGVTQRGAVAGTTTVITDSTGVKTVFTPASGTPFSTAGAPATGTGTGTGSGTGTGTGATSTSGAGTTGFTTRGGTASGGGFAGRR